MGVVGVVDTYGLITRGFLLGRGLLVLEGLGLGVEGVLT